MTNFQVDSRQLEKTPTAPEICDGGAVKNRLDPTPEAQVDASRLEWPDSQVYHRVAIVAGADGMVGG